MSSHTEKVYEKEAYTSQFFAKVIDVDGDLVILDRTAFYPGGGGQDPDSGMLQGCPVVEVRQKDGVVLHKVPGNAFTIGQEVQGTVDMERRLDLMRAHTGEHLLFSALNRLVPDLELVKISITPAKKSLIVRGELNLDIVSEAEKFVNSAIASGLNIKEEIVNRDDPKVLDARVKLERIYGDKIRLIRIGDVDLAACSGIHVKNTSEIGMLLVERLVSAKPQGDFEIEFDVGPIAVQKALSFKTIALKSAAILGSGPEDVVSALENLRTEATMAKDALRSYVKQAVEDLEPEIIGGVPVYHMISRGADRRTLSEEATKKVQDGRSVCILLDRGERTTIVIASGKRSGKDANIILKKCLEPLGGKGGGNSTFATGAIESGAKVEDVLENVKRALSETNV
ncbi:MAG: alanyl-tRNA editing protein [Methanomassiliicoccales archaeon]|nr:MAG: alanyl-tRNA editing protein [Methanomassiliicoccales archaeon]